MSGNAIPDSSNAKKPERTNFIFTHAGRTIDWESTPDQAGIENNDVIMAVELMDLTQVEPVRNSPWTRA